MVTAFDVIAELEGRLTVVDEHDRFVGYLGANERVAEQPGWPNMLDAEGRIARTDRLQPGRFNSPHGFAADRLGNLYVSEWLIGGRTIKLRRC